MKSVALVGQVDGADFAHIDAKKERVKATIYSVWSIDGMEKAHDVWHLDLHSLPTAGLGSR